MKRAAHPSHTIGVDVGGTKVEAILFDGKKVLRRVRVPTEPKKGYAHLLAVIADLVTVLRTPQTSAAGVGVPGFVDKGLWECTWNAKPKFSRKPLARDLARAIKLPVVVESDAKCFALAESAIGAGRAAGVVVGVIVGTGTGCGIVVDGKLLRGSRGAAGELGHAPYKRHDFEASASGATMLTVYRTHGGKEGVTAGDIISGKVKSALAKNIQLQAYDALARLSALIICAYDPDVIVFGGGVSKSLDIARIRREAKTHTPTVFARHARFTRFAISDSAGAIGAALLARNKD